MLGPNAAFISIKNLLYIAAPDISNIPLPSCEEEDDDTSLSSYMSELSVDPLSSGSAAGQHTEDLGNDDVNSGDSGGSCDGDDNDNDDDDDSSIDLEEPDVHGAEAAIFIEGPWQGLDLSAEEQLQSLQSGKNINKLYRYTGNYSLA